MSDLDTPEYWSEAYETERDNWDLEGPTPVFVELVRTFNDMFPDVDPASASVFIPCSGRGYDAVLFAEHGFHVTAVDFSRIPLLDLEQEAVSRGLNIRIVHGDMFKLSEDHREAYDVCLEYTCYCAVDPMRRDELIGVYWNVLKPGGVFIGLMFPIDPRPGGPPFHVDADEFQDKMQERFMPLRSSTPTFSIKPRAGKEILSIWRKPVE